MIDILEQITIQREARGWTEYYLAEQSGLAQTTISSWYRKNMLPSLTSLEKICTAFDMTISQFLAEGQEGFPLTPEQKKLLNDWATLTDAQKELLLKLIQTM